MIHVVPHLFPEGSEENCERDSGPWSSKVRGLEL